MSEFIPVEKGVSIRQPSTANLMIDSQDRVYNQANPSFAWDFSIQKKYSILNGFFTRIATTEVVLNWVIPNISNVWGNDTFTVTSGGTTKTVTLNSNTYNFDQAGFFTVQEALTQIALGLAGTYGGVPLTFSVSSDFGATSGLNYLNGVALVSSPATLFTVTPTVLSQALGFDPTEAAIAAVTHGILRQPNLQPIRYIDFVCPNLTYNQALKDTTTNDAESKTVLCRWYMAWDNPPTLDGLGFPINQGMAPFQERRLFNPAKQIRWDPTMPLGNLQFQVFTDAGTLVSAYDVEQRNVNTNTQANRFAVPGSGWLMTLQVSEV